jgi:hypothetical protein
MKDLIKKYKIHFSGCEQSIHEVIKETIGLRRTNP